MVYKFSSVLWTYLKDALASMYTTHTSVLLPSYHYGWYISILYYHIILTWLTYMSLSLSPLQDTLIHCDKHTHEWIPNRVDPWTLWVHLHRYFSTVNTKLQYTRSGVGRIPQMHRNSEYRWPAILILMNPCVVQGSTAM